MANLQVKSIDDQLYQALSRRARMDNRSISQEVIAIIKEFLSRPRNKHTNNTDEFLNLAGSWKEKRSADEIIKDIRGARATKRFKDVF
ncbi:antitoxin [Fibrobacterota bacterium]